MSDALLTALIRALKPIVRSLLRCGMTYREFAELTKHLFVDAATSDYGLRGRPTNISRVAVMTGLSRKEVSRLRGTGAFQMENATAGRNPAADVLNGWHTYPAYILEDGSPRHIPFAGGGPSFSELVRACAGDIPAGAMLVELLRAAAIIHDENGNVHPLKRYFVPTDVDARLLEGLGIGVSSLAMTVDYNAGLKGTDFARFQRVVQVSGIPEPRVRELRGWIDERLARVTLEIDDRLSRVTAAQSTDTVTVRLGAGAYYFEESGGPLACRTA